MSYKKDMDGKMNKYPSKYPADREYSRGSNERYMGKMNIGKGIMGHASQVHSIDPMPNRDAKKIRKIDSYYSNTPAEAFEYEY